MLYLLGLASLLANTDVNDKMKTVLKRWLLKTLWRYDQAALVRKLRAQGIVAGDTVVVHASWKNDNGFSGSAKDFIDALKTLLGNDGLLIMLSMPYQNQSTRDYLAQGKVFNVNRTPSMMGLLSEVFRRGQGVVRSVNAAHPLLAWGRDAGAFIADHHLSQCSFGADSPFARLAARDAKLLLIDAPFNTITYNHYLEAKLAARFPVPLFDEAPMHCQMLDSNGHSVSMTTRVLSAQSAPYRIDNMLQQAVQRAGKLQQFTLGNTRFMQLKVTDLDQSADKAVHF